ncbi:Transmembrane protein 65, partial [Halocaridina rubra]
MLTGSQCLAFPLKISKCTHVKLGIPSVLDYIRTRTLTTAAISYTNKSGNYIKLDDNVASGNAGSAKGWESKIGTLEVSSETVTELVSVLSPDQRGLLLEEIHKVQATDVKRRAEEKLASWRWRSRFGRPTSVHQLGADPTGTYCEIPQDWLQKKVAEKSKPQRPTGTELRH